MSRTAFSFYSRGGVVLERFEDPDAPGGEDRLPARLCLADPREPTDGLSSEIGRGLPPERRVPWIDRSARGRAAAALHAHGMSGAEAYVLSTPCYEGDAAPWDLEGSQ